MTTTHLRGSLFTRTLPALAMTGALALGVTACGSDNNDSVTTSGSGSSSSAAKPLAEVKDTTGGVTKVTLDPGFLKALTSLKVAAAPLGKAKVSTKGVASFPITGGHVKYYDPTGKVQPYVQGILDHNGSGLSLTAGSTVVKLQNFKVNPGSSTLTGKVTANGKVAAASLPLFFLDGRTLKALRQNPEKTKAILEGTTVKLKQEAATALNGVFKTKALTAGTVIGIAKITVPTK